MGHTLHRLSFALGLGTVFATILTASSRGSSWLTDAPGYSEARRQHVGFNKPLVIYFYAGTTEFEAVFAPGWEDAGTIGLHLNCQKGTVPKVTPSKGSSLPERGARLPVPLRRARRHRPPRRADSAAANPQAPSPSQ